MIETVLILGLIIGVALIAYGVGNLHGVKHPEDAEKLAPVGITVGIGVVVIILIGIGIRSLFL